MVYRVGRWKDVFDSEYPSGLEQVDDASFLTLKKDSAGDESLSGLMPHQVDAAVFLASRAGAILADDMGLGKTRSALAAVRLSRPYSLPAVVITPAGLRKTWESEAKKYWPEATVILADSSADLSQSHDLAIVSYTKLKNFVTGQGFSHAKTLIIDEAHSFKNSRALYGEQRRAYQERVSEGEDPGVHRTAILFDLAEGVGRVYCLTGTPIVSRPKELFNLLKLTKHPIGRNFMHFSSRYCGGRQGRFGWISDGCTNPDELKDKLRNHVLRRHKKSVLKLPAKAVHKIQVPLDMSTHFKYSAAWDDYISMVRETRTQEEAARVWQARHLVQISLLRQICSEAKVEHALKRILRHEGKVVVFSTYSNTIQNLARGLGEAGASAVVYDGSLNEKKRAEAVEAFQGDGGPKVFIAQTESAKVGLTLTAATLVIFMDLVYTPADHYQAEDRCCRIGQREEVRIEYLLCPGTVEDHLVELHDAKKSIIARVFDDDASDADDILSSDVKKELVSKLRGEARSSARIRNEPSLFPVEGF
jgi:SWI/SNF-related matrix-associated actin-dependent regulator 1 of chromatin subfamily A